MCSSVMFRPALHSSLTWLSRYVLPPHPTFQSSEGNVLPARPSPSGTKGEEGMTGEPPWYSCKCLERRKSPCSHTEEQAGSRTYKSKQWFWEKLPRTCPTCARRPSARLERSFTCSPHFGLWSRVIPRYLPWWILVVAHYGGEAEARSISSSRWRLWPHFWRS